MNLDMSASEAVVVHEALMSYVNNHRAHQNPAAWMPADALRAAAADRVLARLDAIASEMAQAAFTASLVPTPAAQGESFTVDSYWRRPLVDDPDAAA